MLRSLLIQFPLTFSHGPNLYSAGAPYIVERETYNGLPIKYLLHISH